MPQHDESAPIFNLTLILLTGESAPDGPGWYITGVARLPNQGSNIVPRRVSVPDAEELARAFENLIPTSGDNSDLSIRPFQLVREGTTQAREAVTQELQRAEQIATTVPRLRKVLGELGA